jgi:hypothetical protein
MLDYHRLAQASVAERPIALSPAEKGDP